MKSIGIVCGSMAIQAAVLPLTMQEQVRVGTVDAPLPRRDHLGAAREAHFSEPDMGLFLEQCDQRHASRRSVSRQSCLQSLKARRLRVPLRRSGGRLDMKITIQNLFDMESTAK